ncbi:MAG: Maf family protein [Rhodobacteraceae bacterium]|nr:Maf family protein [Paracoccaceae bacterium]
MKFILASASSRRLDLLNRIGFVPDTIVSPDIAEIPHKHELPRDFVRRMATSKAQAIEIQPNDVLLAADTIVALGRRILGKPQDRIEAEQNLRLLSGRRHRVITAVMVRNSHHAKIKIVESVIKVKRFSPEELKIFLNTNEWLGKAGGYGIQGHAERFIPWISGSYSGVMGLPLYETGILLESFGLKSRKLSAT